MGKPLFVTLCLHDSLPASRVFPASQLANGKAFVTMGRILDRAATGPKYLSVPEIAKLVVHSLLDGEHRFGRYRLHSFVVMPNHVHLLVTPLVAAAKWLEPLKGCTSNEANAILGRKGQPFWQGESYDHLMESEEEFGRIQRYIENNPLTAGLVADPTDYEWSSAGVLRRQPAESPARQELPL